MKRTWVWIALLGLLGTGISALAGDSGAPKDFASRFKELVKKTPGGAFKVTARPGEDIPEATLNLSFGPGATVSVSRGGPAKNLLDDGDISAVVNKNLRTVKFCYCQALKADPEFEGEAIVGVQVKTTGKVQKVEIQPEDIADHAFGKCLAPRVAKWSFPPFTGQKEDGLALKSIGYEFPLEFSRAGE